MSSAAIFEFKPRNHRRANLSYLDKAELIVLAEHFSPRERADLHCRQASKILARTVALNMRAYFTLCDVGLSMFGLHVHQHERGAEKCRTETPPAEFAGPTARKLQPDDPA